jgi:hypothetical protein
MLLLLTLPMLMLMLMLLTMMMMMMMMMTQIAMARHTTAPPSSSAPRRTPAGRGWAGRTGRRACRHEHCYYCYHYYYHSTLHHHPLVEADLPSFYELFVAVAMNFVLLLLSMMMMMKKITVLFRC